MTEITAAEELDALPVGSVVLDAVCWPWSRHGQATWTTWQHRKTAAEMVAGEHGPFSVLYRPDRDALGEVAGLLGEIRAYLQDHLEDPRAGGLGIRLDRTVSRL